MRSVATVLAFFSLVAATFATSTPASADGCQFTLGFATIQSMIPNTVGACLSDERYAANGDGLQQTTGLSGAGGLLVWRKLDNWTAFTDGFRTWINGPEGLRERLNTERFCWEGDASPTDCLGSSTPSASTTSSVTTSSSSVTSTTSSSGSSSNVVVSSAQGGSASGTTITIHAAPNTPCSFTFRAPDGTVSAMQAVSPTATDSNGNASWSWGNGAASSPGPGTVTITCGGSTASASLPG